MKHFEYTSKRIISESENHKNTINLITELNKAGAEGWELIKIEEDTIGLTLNRLVHEILLKREITQ